MRCTTLLLVVFATIAFGGPSAFAFTQTPDDGFLGTALNTRLQDPEDIRAAMQNRAQAGSSFKIGNTSVFSFSTVGPRGSAVDNDGPFLHDPAADTVPSKRLGW